MIERLPSFDVRDLRSSVTQPSGEGLKSLTSKLGNLSIIPDKNRKKKITMSF
jgi:hypothetical protein